MKNRPALNRVAEEEHLIMVIANVILVLMIINLVINAWIVIIHGYKFLISIYF